MKKLQPFLHKHIIFKRLFSYSMMYSTKILQLLHKIKTRTSFTVTYTLFCIPVVLLITSCIFISLSTTSCTREDAPTSNRNSLLSDLYNQSENYSIKKFLPINLSQYNLSPSSSFSSSQSSGTKSSGEYHLDDFTFSFDADFHPLVEQDDVCCNL